jgi:hypothetical protein
MSDATPMISIYSGQVCVGFILRCGREGFEGLDTAGNGIGKFSTMKEAAKAVSANFLAASGCASCGE